MINPQLKEFVQKQLSAGVSRDIITSQLTTNGWNAFDIAEVFDALTEHPKAPKPIKTGGFFFLFSAGLLVFAGLGILVWVFLR